MNPLIQYTHETFEKHISSKQTKKKMQMAELTGLSTVTMNWESNNLPETWQKFQTTVEFMFRGPLRDKEEKIQVRYLLL